MEATHNQIIDLLQWTPVYYEQNKLSQYWSWCVSYGKWPSITQQLFANREVNYWFLMEIEKLESQFLTIFDTLPKNNILQLEQHYRICTNQIMLVFPKPLLDKCRKNRDFSNEIVTNTLIYYAN